MFTRQELKDMATPASFSRGQAYFEEGAVGRLHVQVENTAFSATVSGSEDYLVKLIQLEGGASFSCACPSRQEGICKHSVALGLAVLEQQENSTMSEFESAENHAEKPVKQLVAAVAAPSAAELERALKEVAKPDKLKFLEQHLRQQPTLASAFVQHFYGNASPADPLDEGVAALPQFSQLQEQLRLALTRLRFDYDTLAEDDGEPLPTNYAYTKRAELLERAINIVYQVLRPVAATIHAALAAGHLAEGLRRLQGAGAGMQLLVKPAADVFRLFSGSYAYIVSQSWLVLLRETEVYTLLSETAFEAKEAARCVPVLVSSLLENPPPAVRQPSAKYAPSMLPGGALGMGTEQVLVAAAANPSLAQFLKPSLLPYENQLTLTLRLQLAAGLQDWETWSKLAAEEAKQVPDIAQKLLQFHLDRANQPALLQAATTLLGYQKQVVSAFVLAHVAPVEDRLLYVQALTYRVFQEQDFADFVELTGLWKPEERHAFVQEVLGKYKPRFSLLFVAQVLAAEHRSLEILPLALQLDWHPRTTAYLSPAEQLTRSNLDDLPEMLVLAALAQPEPTLDAVMERVEKYLAKAPKRTNELYQRIGLWLKALHELPALTEQVAMFADGLYTTYSKLARLRTVLREAQVLPEQDLQQPKKSFRPGRTLRNPL